MIFEEKNKPISDYKIVVFLVSNICVQIAKMFLVFKGSLTEVIL